MNYVGRYLLIGVALISMGVLGSQPNEFVQEYRGKRLVVVRHGDITQQHVDAIVNAAQPSLLGGGGIDGAIHCAAGKNLRDCCAQLSQVASGVRCATGDARLTPAFGLERQGIKYIIHTVGPRVSNSQWRTLLRSSYLKTLDWLLQPADVLAAGIIHTIAIPSISIGIYGCPVREATHIAINTVKGWLDNNSERARNLQEIRLLIFDINPTVEAQNFDIYVQELQGVSLSHIAPIASLQPSKAVIQQHFLSNYKKPIIITASCLLLAGVILFWHFWR